MKPFTLGILSLLLFAPTARGQFTIDWFTVDGGGVMNASGGTFTLSGTIGQPDAGGAMSGGNYSVTGGFWALIQVVQTPGAPTLYIGGSGSTVTVYWQNVSGWSLIQNGNLTTPVASWSANNTATLTGGTNYLTLTNPPGNLFYRLTHP